MKLSELVEISESVSTTDSAIDQLIANAGSMSTLYLDRLNYLVKNMYAEGMHEDMYRTVKKLVGQAKGRWFSENYFSTSSRRNTPTQGLKNALLAIAKDPIAKSESAALKELGSFVVLGNTEKQFQKLGTSSGQYMTQLGIELPRVMISLASKIQGPRSESLKTSGVRLRNAISSFEQLFDRLQDEWDREWGAGAEQYAQNTKDKALKQSKQEVMGSQYSQADVIINQVLGSLDKQVANDIRRAIAKSDNKMLSLQQELTKRNIQL